MYLATVKDLRLFVRRRVPKLNLILALWIKVAGCGISCCASNASWRTGVRRLFAKAPQPLFGTAREYRCKPGGRRGTGNGSLVFEFARHSSDFAAWPAEPLMLSAYPWDCSLRKTGRTGAAPVSRPAAAGPGGGWHDCRTCVALQHRAVQRRAGAHRRATRKPAAQSLLPNLDKA